MDTTPTMQSDRDIIGEILEDMDLTHGCISQPEAISPTIDINLPERPKSGDSVEESAREQPVTVTPATTPVQNSQLDQLTLAITSLTRNFQRYQQNALVDKQDSPTYKGKGKGVGKSSTRKSTDKANMAEAKTAPVGKTVAPGKTGQLAPIFKPSGGATKAQGREGAPKTPAGLEKGYKIPKKSQTRKPERGPPPKKARVDKTHEMSDEMSDADWEGDSDSEIDYPIDFDDEEIVAESGTDTIDDRINELLRSTNPHGHVVEDGQQPSTSRGTVSRQTVRPDLEQGELPEEVDAGLAEIVQELSNDDEVGPDIAAQLAGIFTKLLGSKIPAERIKNKMEENPPPGNVPLMQPPRVNDVVWNSLDQPARELDLKHKRIQAKLTRGLAALSRMTEMILNNKKTSTIPDYTGLLEKAMTAFALLASANYELSLRRREVMRFELNPRFARLCFASTPVTTDLFGDEMPKLVEDIQRSHKIERNITYRGKRGGYQNQGRRGYGRGRGNQSNRGNRQYYNGGNNNNNSFGNGRGNRGSFPKNSRRGANRRQQ